MVVKPRGPLPQAAFAVGVALTADAEDGQALAGQRTGGEFREGVLRDVQSVEVGQLEGVELVGQFRQPVVGQVQRDELVRILALEAAFGDFRDTAAPEDDVGHLRFAVGQPFGELRDAGVAGQRQRFDEDAVKSRGLLFGEVRYLVVR